MGCLLARRPGSDRTPRCCGSLDRLSRASVDQLKPFVSQAKALLVSNALIFWRYSFRCLPFGSNGLPNPALNKDLEHLKLLTIFHYIVGGLACFCGLLWVIYIVSGVILLIASGSMTGDDRMGAAIGGVLATIVGFVLFVLFEAYGILCVIAGRKYAKPEGYRFCFVLAVFTCLNFPLGTALGVFAIVVLNRPSVKARFQGLPATEIAIPPIS
jgi:hypothetical protein